MFRQGDREAAMGLPPSPLMDRAKGGITKGQTGFLNVVAMPMFKVGWDATTQLLLFCSTTIL